MSAKALFGILSGKAVKARSCCGASFCFENPTFTARRYAVTLYGAENGVKSVGKTFAKGKARRAQKRVIRQIARLKTFCASLCIDGATSVTQ